MTCLIVVDTWWSWLDDDRHTCRVIPVATVDDAVNAIAAAGFTIGDPDSVSRDGAVKVGVIDNTDADGNGTFYKATAVCLDCVSTDDAVKTLKGLID